MVLTAYHKPPVYRVISILRSRTRAETVTPFGGNMYQTYAWTEDNSKCNLEMLLIKWALNGYGPDFIPIKPWPDYQNWTKPVFEGKE